MRFLLIFGLLIAAASVNARTWKEVNAVVLEVQQHFCRVDGDRYSGDCLLDKTWKIDYFGISAIIEIDDKPYLLMVDRRYRGQGSELLPAPHYQKVSYSWGNLGQSGNEMPRMRLYDELAYARIKGNKVKLIVDAAILAPLDPGHNVEYSMPVITNWYVREISMRGARYRANICWPRPPNSMECGYWDKPEQNPPLGDR